MNCRSFWGSLSHCLNSGPRAWAASCAASGISPVVGSAATNLTWIDADGGVFVIAQSFFNLLGEFLRLGAAHGKGADQAREVLERDLAGKQDAGKSGGIQQLCEAALRLSGFERNAIEKKFVVGDAEQKAGVAIFRQRLLQFLPGGFELAFGALVRHSIQPCVLDQDIEAMKEGPSGGAAAGIVLDGVSDSQPPDG